jgi:hypothetical protein
MPDINNQPASIESRIEAIKPNLSLKDQKRLRLELLLRVARRLDSFSVSCETCPGHRTAIDRLVDSLKDVDKWQIPEWKAYYRSFDGIVKHLKTAHHLVEEGEHLSMWIGIGVAIGAGLGAAFNQVAIGAGVGVALGVAIGGMLDAVAHKQGRVI